MKLAIAALGLAACGRVGFDPSPIAATDATGDAVSDGLTIPGLLGWWKLDEPSGLVASDSSGNALDGTLVNMPIWMPTGGKHGGALSFGPPYSFVDIGAPASLANLAALSVSAWVNASTLPPPGNPHCIVDKGNFGVGWYFSVSNYSVGDLYFVVYFAGQALTRVSATTLAAGAWQHVMLTWNGGTSGAGVRFYIDGVEVAYDLTSDGVGGRNDDSTAALGIDCMSLSANFEAMLDDVQVYDRELSASEVLMLASS